LRRKGLSDPNLDLAALIQQGKAFELADQQALDMEKCVREVNKLSFKKTFQKKHSVVLSKKPNSTCYFCGGRFPHNTECLAKNKKCNNCGKIGHFSSSTRCPAKGKTCTSCHKKNHFSSVCRSSSMGKHSSKVHTLQSEDSDIKQTTDSDMEDYT
jgi:hypothetical protein